MQESGAAGRQPRADRSALFEGEFAADPITRPIGSVVSRKAKPRAAKSCLARLDALRS